MDRGDAAAGGEGGVRLGVWGARCTEMSGRRGCGGAGSCERGLTRHLLPLALASAKQETLIVAATVSDASASATRASLSPPWVHGPTNRDHFAGRRRRVARMRRSGGRPRTCSRRSALGVGAELAKPSLPKPRRVAVQSAGEQ
jgi:hypothetical protein